MQIDAVFLLELIGEKFNQPKVEVLTAEERVTVGGQDLKLMLSINLCNFNDRDVEGAATQIVDSDSAIALGFVHAISKRRRGGLIDNPLDLKTRDPTRIFGGLPLRIIEVCRYCDHRLSHRFAEVLLRGLLHFAQDFG